MKQNRWLISFAVVLTIGLIIINFVIDWDKIGEKSKDIADIKLPEGYEARIALKGLINPSSLCIDKDGNIYIAENIYNNKNDAKNSDSSNNSNSNNSDSGYNSNEGNNRNSNSNNNINDIVKSNSIKHSRIVKYTKDGKCTVVIGKLKQPISYLMFHREQLYISQKGSIAKLTEDGVVDLVSGLPSLGDYSNNAIAYGYDGMIYICQGAATNSGVVGMDNFNRGWLKENPYFHDYPPIDCALGGYNFKSVNPLSMNKNNTASTGAFLPFNTISLKSESIKGRLPGTACILRLSTYGNIEDTFAWGIRNPVGIVIMPDTKIYVSAQGMEERGSRPIANGSDYIYELKKNQWLGWPDYEGGEPVTLKKFRAKNFYKSTQFIMELHPTLNPQKPIATFSESGRIGYIDMCTNSTFGLKNSIFIPLKKGFKEEAKIVAFDTKTNSKVDFISNKEGSGLIYNPVQCLFSKDGKLYVLENSNGVLLEITKINDKKESILPSSLSIEYFIGLVLAGFVLYVAVSIVRKR